MKQTFKSFMLVNGVDAKSISSYFSYVKNAYEKFMKKDFKKQSTIYDRLFELSKRSRVRYCEYVISLLNVELQHPCSTYSKKTLSNYKSGMTMLKRFVDSDIYPIDGKKQFAKTFSISYSPDELLDNFIWRLETQDRIYKSKNCFPCRVFSKIYTKHHIDYRKYYDMMKLCLDKTKFLVNGSKDYATLQQVEKLDIMGGVKIWVNNIDYDIFTEVIKKKCFKGCVVTSAKILEELSLDHDEPLESIVNREIHTLPELKRLSDAFWAHHKATGLKGSSLTTSFCNNEYAKLLINEAQLLDEVCEVYKHVTFTIMEKRYNSALGNSFVPTPPFGSNIR